jgi:hypothetical protein
VTVIGAELAAHRVADFLAQRHTAPLFKKFLQERIDAGNYEALRLAG